MSVISVEPSAYVIMIRGIPLASAKSTVALVPPCGQKREAQLVILPRRFEKHCGYSQVLKVHKCSEQ